jgi:hypothetical protein
MKERGGVNILISSIHQGPIVQIKGRERR